MGGRRPPAHEGTFRQPEASAWLWSNDTRARPTPSRCAPCSSCLDDPRRHGLVQWLFLNRKLGHWKSTRATAEALYALVRLSPEGRELGAAESATVRRRGEDRRLQFPPEPSGEPDPPDDHPRRSARPRPIRGRGGEGDPRLPLRLRHLALLYRGSAGRGERRPLPRRSPLFPARYDEKNEGGRKGFATARRRSPPQAGRRGRGMARRSAAGSPRVRAIARPPGRRPRARRRRLRLALGAGTSPPTRRRATAPPASSSKPCPPASTSSSTACAPTSPASSGSAPPPCNRCMPRSSWPIRERR